MGRRAGGNRDVKRIPHRCRSCGFKTKLSEIEAEARMICPECHCGSLYEERKRRGPGVVGVRPAVIRALLGGILLIFGGAGLLVWAKSMPPKADNFSARITAYGIVALIGGGISVIAGLIGLGWRSD
jgi:hypothetical protein